jgi:RNA polymerase sigma factor FliA
LLLARSVHAAPKEKGARERKTVRTAAASNVRPLHAPQAPTRDERIVQNIGLVKRLARMVAARVPARVSLDDLIGAGMLGLVLASDRYDGVRGVPFETFARWRIHGALLDFLRGEDPLTREARRRIRESQRSGAEGGEPQFLDVDALADRLSAEGTPTGNEAADALARIRLRNVVANLPEGDRKLLELYYGEEQTLREVGNILGVTESRICQRLSGILSRVRASLKAG